jgi:heptosyltransferase-3
MPDRFDRILVIATRQIGDVLLTTPLIHAARLRWPQARIDVLGYPGTLGMLRGNPDVAGCIEVPSGGPKRQWAFAWRLWRRYDLALVTQQSDRAHLYGWVAAPLRSGLVPGRTSTSWWKRRLLVHAVTIAGDRGEVHTVDEKLALLEPWRNDRSSGVDVVPPAAARLPAELERRLAARFVVVQVPSMWRYKQWPVEHFRVLVGALLSDGVQVVLTGSAAPGDRAQVDAVLSTGQPPLLLDMAGRLDLNQLTGLLQRAALYIGPDTSITHLAASVQVPMIALFGPTNPMRWGPLPMRSKAAPVYVRNAREPQRGGRIVLIQGPGRKDTPDCVPCGRAGCEDHRDSRSECLEGIVPARVIDEARRLLALPSARRA